MGENIAYGKPDATREEIEEAAKKANIHDFIQTPARRLSTLMWGSAACASPADRSSASRLRVCSSRTRRVLILDEATSALDNESERAIQASLEKLAENRTTIVIAHRLSTIRHAQEILVVSEGQIRERGTHEQLLAANGIYARYQHMQDDWTPPNGTMTMD